MPFANIQGKPFAKRSLVDSRLTIVAKRGQVLIIALVFLAVILILSASLFDNIARFLRFATRSVQGQQATNLADGGADYALWQLNLSSSYAGNETKPLGTTGQFQVGVTTVGSIKKITSTGCIPTCANPKTKRVVKVEVTQTASVDNLPVISYIDDRNNKLKVAKCGSASCNPASGTNTISTVDSGGDSISIAIGSDGYPVISYPYPSSSNLNVVKCGSASCNPASGTNTISTVDSTDNQYSSIAIGSDGYPVISYRGTHILGKDLNVVKCGSASCNPASGTNTISTVDSTSSGFYDTSIAIGTDGYPVISYRYSTGGKLKVAKCGSASCNPASGTNTISTVDSGSNVGYGISIAIGSDGYPVISYQDAALAGLKVAKCGSASCNPASGTNTISTVDTAFVRFYVSLAKGSGAIASRPWQIRRGTYQITNN